MMLTGESIYIPSCSALHKLKKMHICQHCGAKKFDYETPTFCCDSGKIKLAEVNAPSELKLLFIDESDDGQEF